MSDMSASNPQPSSRPAARAGGQIVADALAVHGVDTIFCVPGESYLAVLDGLYDIATRIALRRSAARRAARRSWPRPTAS